MPKPLDERIAAAMSQDARIATVAELIAEVDEETSKAQREHDRLDRISKSATANEAEADAAADEASKLARKVIRLKAKRDQLEKRREEITNSERQKKLRAEYDAAKSRRDALAADLADRWPAITSEIVSLLERLEASDRECFKINQAHAGERLFSAESIARDCSPIFRDGGWPLTRFHETSIPSLRRADGQELAWPKSVLYGSTIAVPIP